VNDTNGEIGTDGFTKIAALALVFLDYNRKIVALGVGFLAHSQNACRTDIHTVGTALAPVFVDAYFEGLRGCLPMI
jgi:hypothetical protein